MDNWIICSLVEKANFKTRFNGVVTIGNNTCHWERSDHRIIRPFPASPKYHKILTTVYNIYGVHGIRSVKLIQVLYGFVSSLFRMMNSGTVLYMCALNIKKQISFWVNESINIYFISNLGNLINIYWFRISEPCLSYHKTHTNKGNASAQMLDHSP